MHNITARVYLTRRNLNKLLELLDEGHNSRDAASITKYDVYHPEFPQNVYSCHVTAIEDEDYYINREPGV